MHPRHETGIHHAVSTDDDAEATKSLTVHTREFTEWTERPGCGFDARFSSVIKDRRNWQ
jgi:hypothetical protein